MKLSNSQQAVLKRLSEIDPGHNFGVVTGNGKLAFPVNTLRSLAKQGLIYLSLNSEKSPGAAGARVSIKAAGRDLIKTIAR